jgi:predicted nucleotidyltransferase
MVNKRADGESSKGTGETIQSNLLQARYKKALDELVLKLKQDRYVVAAILCGSLSHDEVWEKSDIDLLVITTEEQKVDRNGALVEDGIDIHAIVMGRNAFKTRIQSSLQSSFFHSFFSKSTLLFSHDETIEELYRNVHHLGARDREIQLLRTISFVLPALSKAEKWLVVKNDPHYSLLWIVQMLSGLASLEVLQHGEITGREVVQQALRHNPDFFHSIYTDLLDAPKTPERIQIALDSINEYLQERIFIFQPLLDYLSQAGGARSMTEISHYFKREMDIGFVDSACEWLAERDIIQKVSLPMRLTPRSGVDLPEAAYYYDGD